MLSALVRRRTLSTQIQSYPTHDDASCLSPPPSDTTESGTSLLFLPLLFLGTASGEFLRPAASRLLLSRFLPNLAGSLPECSRSPWEQRPSLLGASGK
jgi:hypothetical protein